jgi:hypothetical protein
MLKKISLTILFLSILASPTFGGGFNRDSNHQVNPHRQGLFFKNNFNNSTRIFQSQNFKFRAKSRDKTRIPKFIGFPYYGIYSGDSYERGEKEAVNIIVESNKKDETTGPPAKTEKPVQPPHIITLENKESRKDLKSSGGIYRVVEIRGTEVRVVSISSE